MIVYDEEEPMYNVEVLHLTTTITPPDEEPSWIRFYPNGDDESSDPDGPPLRSPART